MLLYFYILLLTSDKNTIKKNNNNAVTRLLNRGTKINGNMLIPFISIQYLSLFKTHKLNKAYN